MKLRHGNYEPTPPLADGAHLADDLVGYIPGQDDKICGSAIKHELWCDDMISRAVTLPAFKNVVPLAAAP